MSEVSDVSHIDVGLSEIFGTVSPYSILFSNKKKKFTSKVEIPDKRRDKHLGEKCTEVEMIRGTFNAATFHGRVVS